MTEQNSASNLSVGPYALFDRDGDPNDLISGFWRADYAPNTLPERLVLAFLGPTVDEFAHERGWECRVELDSITRDFPYWVTERNGVEVGVVLAPLGASAATQNLEFGLALGANKIIAVGSCGALDTQEENVFFIPQRALRDEGTSFKYLPAEDWIDLDAAGIEAVEAALAAQGRAGERVTVWTTDGFLRETPAIIERRRAAGCDVVDMECSALAAVSRFRGATYGQLLYTADSLADLDKHDPRGWGKASRGIALDLAIEAASRL